jgi:uncharacterized repeat protein (TIGR01451 family)
MSVFRIWVTIPLMVCMASFALAKSAEQARVDNPWSTYQGGSGHTGYVPVSLDFSSGAVLQWDMGFFVGPLPGNSAITLWHDNTLTDDGETRYFFEPALNQISVVEGKLFLSNRGFKLPHTFWIVDEEKEVVEAFYDYRFDTHLNFNDRTYWPATTLRPDDENYVPPVCPNSQSQPAVFNNGIFINTNAWRYESPLLCGSHSGPITRFAHLRQFPFIWTKLEDGHEASGGPIIDALMHPIEANEFDMFLAPTPYSSGSSEEEIHSIYSMGGGQAKERKNSGIYAFSADKDIATNLWAGNTEFASVAANDLWTPAVNEDYVVAYTAIKHPDEVSYTLPGGRFWVFDRETGSELFIVEDLDYVAEDSVRPFHMNRAPALFENYVVEVGHKQVQGAAKGRLLAIDLSKLDEDTRRNGFEFEIEKLTGSGFSGQVSISPNTVDSANGAIVYAVANGGLEAFYLESNGSAVRDSDDNPWVWMPAGEVIVPPFIITDTHAIVKTALAADLSDTVNVYAVDLSLTEMSSAARISHRFLDGGGGAITGDVHLSVNFDRLYIARSDSVVQGKDSATVADYLLEGRPDPDDVATLSKSRVYVYALELLPEVYSDVIIRFSEVRSNGSSIIENDGIAVGDRVEYTLDISNASADIDATDVVVTSRLSGSLKIEPDNLPVECDLGGDDNRSLSCDVGRIAKVDGATTDNKTLILDARVIGESGILLEVEADGAEIDWDFSNNTVSFGVDGIAGAANADLTLDAQISNGFGQHGDQLTLTYTIVNSGPEEATGVELALVLPDEFLFVSGSGCSATLQLVLCSVANSLAKDVSAGELTIVVEVSALGVTEARTLGLFNLVAQSTSLDRSDGNNVVSIKDFVIQPVVVEPDPVDLSISISGVANSLQVGQSETFTVQVANAGPGVAENAVFVVALPANFRVDISSDTCASGDQFIDCGLGDMAAGAAQSFDISISLISVSDEFLTLSAFVSSDSVDSDTNNDSYTSGSIATFARSIDGDGGSSGGGIPLGICAMLVVLGGLRASGVSKESLAGMQS